MIQQYGDINEDVNHKGNMKQQQAYAFFATQTVVAAKANSIEW